MLDEVVVMGEKPVTGTSEGKMKIGDDGGKAAFAIAPAIPIIIPAAIVVIVVIIVKHLIDNPLAQACDLCFISCSPPRLRKRGTGPDIEELL